MALDGACKVLVGTGKVLIGTGKVLVGAGKVLIGAGRVLPWLVGCGTSSQPPPPSPRAHPVADEVFNEQGYAINVWLCTEYVLVQCVLGLRHSYSPPNPAGDVRTRIVEL